MAPARGSARTIGTGSALVALLALGACTGQPAADDSSGPVTIEVWVHSGTPGELETITAQVEDFNAAQAGAVTATLTVIAEGDYSNALQGAIAAGTVPDVMEVDGPMLASLDHQGALADLNALLPDKTVTQLIPSLLAQGTIDGRLVGAGAFDSGLGIFGNRALLDAAGVAYPTGLEDTWTGAEFTAALASLAANDADGMVLDLKRNYGAGEWLTYGFAPLLWSAGGDLIDRETGAAGGVLDGPEAVEAMTLLQSWTASIDPNTEDLAFTSGAVALSWVGHWAYPAYAEALGTDLLVLPLPDLGLGAKTGQGSFAWSIGASSAEPEAAAAFVDLVLSKDEVATMALANGAVPGRIDVLAESELYGSGGALERLSHQLTRTCGAAAPSQDCVAVPRPLTPAYPVITANVAQAIDEILSGRDVQQALRDAAVDIDADLEANGGYQDS